MSNEYKDWDYDKEKEVKQNKELIKRFPWLLPIQWDGELPEDYDYSYTWLDDMPYIWRTTFGLQMCEEIQFELEKLSETERREFRILQIKEKYGGLRFYTSFTTNEIYQIIDKYEKRSMEICFKCGKPATHETKGWILFVCDECDPNYEKESQI